MKKVLCACVLVLAGCTDGKKGDDSQKDEFVEIEQREWEIVDKKYYTDLEELLTIPATFDYDFKLLCNDHPMRILTPSDKRFRIYCLYSGGTAKCATNYLQYFDKKGVLHVQNLDPWEGPGVAFGPELNEIKKIKDGYVLLGYTRTDSNDVGGFTSDTVRYEDFDGGLRDNE